MKSGFTQALQLGAMALLIALADPTRAQGWRPGSNVTLKAEWTLRETFDNNVFLQNDPPSAALTNAVRPYRQSLVTSLTPRLGLDWKPMPEFNLATDYAPEVVRFHSEPSENHVTHRANLTFSGQVGVVQWEQFNTLTWIDGSREGLTFGITNGAGQLVGAPAIGGIPIRDRRAALIYRNGFRALHAHGDWFFRPVAWSYVHDFRTRQRNRPGYQNYVDRNDFTVGMDLGYRALPSAFVIVGYRYGFQQEPPYPWSDVHYSNDYHRFVVGLEGKLTDWLRIVGVVGPDYRDFNPHVPAGFDDHHTRLYYDASAVVQPGPNDSITLSARQFEQPAFGAPSVYEDITWEISWRHRFDSAWTLSVGFRAYGGDWLEPVQRDDWIYTTSVAIVWRPGPHLSAELSHSYDWVESRIPDTDGREFTRHLLSVSVKYVF